MIASAARGLSARSVALKGGAAALAFGLFLLLGLTPSTATEVATAAPPPVAPAPASVAVPVPIAPIYPGQPIRDDQLADKKYKPSITRAAVHQNRQDVVGKVARRALIPGQPIPIIALKEAEPVSAGQSVAVVFASEGIEITGRGVALQAGKVGDLIQVRNVDSGVVIRAVVASDGTVHVGPN